ncbi:MAG: LPS-assembly protein LptD [Flavobacteriales bacterium]|nr:MAG: LPS-assembly protein LptD [Flavobacteriales bacterium]|tara:strand:+ start:12981 stop:14618 length:1638 start_codon:yes stop_codon:yes gene_type:complete
MKPVFTSCLLLLLSFGLSTQEQEIEIRKAGSFQLDQDNFPGANILTRSATEQVHLVHQGMDVWSDKAFFYKAENRFNAIGNVRVQQGDSLVLTSKLVNYDGNRKLAVAKENVILDNIDMLLETDTLYFDRIADKAYYPTSGTVYDSLTTITSKRGTYISESKKYQFENQVVITNPDFTITSARMDFYTESKHAFFYGKTTIIGEDYVVRCKQGFYDTERKLGFFKKEASVDYDNRNIMGDSIYFDDEKQYAAATQNIRITDTINNTFLTGNYGQVFKAQDSAMVTHRAVAINLVEQDSLFIHADTLIATGPPEKRILRGFHDVRIFKEDLSGKSDSIHFNQKNGRARLIRQPMSDKELQFLTPQEIADRNPILWSDESQMTGDEIHLIIDMEREVLDSLLIYNNAFIIEQDTLDLNNFNQIKGLQLKGKFNGRSLETVDVVQNTEMVYYLYDDDTLDLVGIDKAICSALRLTFVDSAIDKVTFFTNPDGVVYPPEELPENTRQMLGFSWRENERISTKEDLFHGIDLEQFTMQVAPKLLVNQKKQ